MPTHTVQPSTSIQNALKLEMTLDQISGSIPAAPTKTMTIDSIVNVVMPILLLGLLFLFLVFLVLSGISLSLSSIPDLLAAQALPQFVNAAISVIGGLVLSGVSTLVGFFVGSHLREQAKAGQGKLKVDRQWEPMSFTIQRDALFLDGDRISWSLVNPATTSVIQLADTASLHIGFRDGTSRFIPSAAQHHESIEWLCQTIIDRATSFGTEDDVPDEIKRMRVTPTLTN